MLKNKTMAKGNGEPTNQHINIIGVGTTIQGDINSEGDVRIDGKLKGNIETKGRFILGPQGEIVGDIHCRNSDIEGTLEGRIFCKEMLVLKASSKLQGEVTTEKLQIEPGAILSGSCKMGAESKKPAEIEGKSKKS